MTPTEILERSIDYPLLKEQWKELAEVLHETIDPSRKKRLEGLWNFLGDIICAHDKKAEA